MYKGVGVCHTIANLAMLENITVLKSFSLLCLAWPVLPTTTRTTTRLTVTPAIQIFSSLSIISVHNFNPNANARVAAILLQRNANATIKITTQQQRDVKQHLFCCLSTYLHIFEMRVPQFVAVPNDNNNVPLVWFATLAVESRTQWIATAQSRCVAAWKYACCFPISFPFPFVRNPAVTRRDGGGGSRSSVEMTWSWQTSNAETNWYNS